jgi:sugar/nucleoside kinase (ribokinase family)/DNA-binding MurR/RpiR family transcriptional regulator
MQRIFRDRLVQRSSSYRERIATMRRVTPGLSRPKTVLHDFVSDSIAHLSHLEEHVSAERLDQAVTVLARARRIHVLAQRRAFPVACYLAYALGQLELSVSLLDGVGGMVREQARAIRAEDALVAVSFRSYSTEVIELTADAHRRGVPVVVITDSAVSPLVRGATVAFDLGDDSDRPFRSLVEPICLAQAPGRERRPQDHRAGRREERQGGAAREAMTGPQGAERGAAPARPFDVACLGRAAVDLYGEQIGTSLEHVATFARYLGGSPANTAVGAARLGLRPAMISRVGDEQNGRFVRETLEREGVDVSQVATDPRRLTALVFLAIRDRDDFPHLFYRDNCADMGLVPADIDAAFIARCRALLVSGTHLSQPGPRAAAERAIAAACAAGTRVSSTSTTARCSGASGPADGAERYAASERRPRASPRCCRAATSSSAPRRSSASRADPRTSLAALRAVRARLARCWCSSAASRAASPSRARFPAGSRTARAPGFPVEVFNVLGAGDAFMAGFLRGWLRDEPLATCCRYANACGAIVVSRHGCAPAMPTYDELRHFLDHGSSTPRLREDAQLDHLHRAATRRAIDTPLFILAFDHRAQLEAVALVHGQQPGRIAHFKSLVCEAFLRSRLGRGGGGVIVDDRYGEAILPKLTAGATGSRGRWSCPARSPSPSRRAPHSAFSCAPGPRSTSPSASCSCIPTTPRSCATRTSSSCARSPGAARPPGASC